MRVLMLSKACIVGIYQGKLEAIARKVDALKVAVPPFWRDERGIMPLERAHVDGYDLHVTPMHFNGNFHLHYYPEFGRIVRDFKPDIVHIDEEPYNLATWLALRAAYPAKTLFFSWQNINRCYPLPIRMAEKWVLNTVDYALMGTESAAQVWREKGYTGNLAVIPQFGVDPSLFTPRTGLNPVLQIGYIGRLVREKTVDLLIDALATLEDLDWHFNIIGSGPEKENLSTQVKNLNLEDRVTFIGQVPSVEMPAYYQKLDILALPSRTMPNWKEQFGRVLIEAMATKVTVIGSDSGAIPDVIGDTGLVFRENDQNDLAEKLRCMLEDRVLLWSLAEKGYHRVLANFTQEQVAEQTVTVYREMLFPPK